jgi:hypothetical protein
MRQSVDRSQEDSANQSSPKISHLNESITINTYDISNSNKQLVNVHSSNVIATVHTRQVLTYRLQENPVKFTYCIYTMNSVH